MKDKVKLVKKAVKGSERAFEQLIKNESEKLYKTAFLYVKNKEDALDVLQETIYKAFVSIEQVKQPEFFTTWLTRILIRTSYDFLDKKNKLVLDEDFLKHQASEDTSNMEEKLDLLAAISALSKTYQTVIILFYYHDLSIQSIGNTLEMSENTVKTNLRRAKMELKKQLGGIAYEQTAYQ